MFTLYHNEILLVKQKHRDKKKVRFVRKVATNSRFITNYNAQAIHNQRKYITKKLNAVKKLNLKIFLLCGNRQDRNPAESKTQEGEPPKIPPFGRRLRRMSLV